MAKILAQKDAVHIFVSETSSKSLKEEINSQYSAQMELMAVTNSTKMWKRPISITELAQSSYFSEIRLFLPSMELGLSFLLKLF